MDELGGGCIVVAIVIAIIGYVLWAIGMAIYYFAGAIVWLFGTHVAAILGLALIGMIAGAIYHQRQNGSSRPAEAMAKIGPFEASPKGWFYGSTVAMLFGLIVYRMIAF
jgi:hypothetical protein